MPSTLVDLPTFRLRHLAALERDEARYNLMLGLVDRAQSAPEKFRFWSLGDGARCAIQSPPRAIILGDLTSQDADRLAEEVRPLNFEGCNGMDGVPAAFASALALRGIHLTLTMPQRIHRLEEPPRYPKVSGRGRPARPGDIELYADWLLAFCIEALVAEPPPERAAVVAAGFDRAMFFWEVSGVPVAMACRSRETRHGSNISLVYTPPGLRGKGYGGAVTAYVCDQIFASGKRFACLYTDLRNPVSNHVYAKIGFVPHGEAASYTRVDK